MTKYKPDCFLSYCLLGIYALYDVSILGLCIQSVEQAAIRE